MTAAPHMAEALKPCPFCGGEAHHNDGGGSVYGRFWWRVGCPECGVTFADEEHWVHGMLDPAYPPKHCFAAWNRRAPDEKDAEIARLREALAEALDDAAQLARALRITAAILQAEMGRSGGQPFTGHWSIPALGERVTVSGALDTANLALGAYDLRTPT